MEIILKKIDLKFNSEELYITRYIESIIILNKIIFKKVLICISEKNIFLSPPPKAQTDAFKANLDISSNRFDLQWENFPQSGELEDVYFFDITEQITSDKPQTLEQTEQGWKLSLSRAAYASAKPKRMHGWLRWKMAGEDFHWARLDLPINWTNSDCEWEQSG